MHYSFDFRRRAATDQFPSSLSSSTAFPVERKTQYVHFLSSRQLPNYKKKHHQLLPCIGLTSVASASNEQPLIRSGVHRIFKRIEGDMVGSVQLGDVFRQVPDGRTTRNERTACKRWALVHSWFAVLALSGTRHVYVSCWQRRVIS